MKRLTIPEPDITLYEDGFEGHDLLGRETTGDALSELVDRIEEPMVIALDGGWGSGKSFFLKCWVGHHLQRKENTTQTVYFDAFANDFVDEPLVSLLACLLNRFEAKVTEDQPELVADKAILDTLKEKASSLRPAAFRVATGVGAALIKTYVGDLSDALTDKVEEELSKSVDGFWATAQKQQDIMTEFSDALKALTVGPEGEQRKLLIVVDELDRCRPDYALALLEIIKHFFAVDHVHFVLGVNLSELENSVKARYGGGINAGLYLQKFVTLTMGLPDKNRQYHTDEVAVQYFGILASKMDISRDMDKHFRGLIANYTNKENVSLRSMKRLLTVLQISDALSSRAFDREDQEQFIWAALVLLKAWDLALYKRAKSGTLTIPELAKAFLLTEDMSDYENSFGFRHLDAWQYFLEPEKHLLRRANEHERVAPTKSERQRELQYLIHQHFEVFQINF